MTMNPLPPQAYTKDTLTQAFAWLQTQNDNIKELATTPDILVSLYLKAKMQGDHALERPSIQNFKKELKSLAGMIEALEAPPAPKPMPPIIERTEKRSESPAPTGTPALPAPAPARTGFDIQSLDEKSLLMIREVKERYNLSSDSETLRLLLSTGFHQLKALSK